MVCSAFNLSLETESPTCAGVTEVTLVAMVLKFSSYHVTVFASSVTKLKSSSSTQYSSKYSSESTPPTETVFTKSRDPPPVSVAAFRVGVGVSGSTSNCTVILFAQFVGPRSSVVYTIRNLPVSKASLDPSLFGSVGSKSLRRICPDPKASAPVKSAIS